MVHRRTGASICRRYTMVLVRVGLPVVVRVLREPLGIRPEHRGAVRVCVHECDIKTRTKSWNAAKAHADSIGNKT